MSRRILFTSQKGGVGKSTLARAAAVALASAKRKVLLADFDIEQRTCIRWHSQRVARGLQPAIAAEAFTKPKKLARVEDGFDDVVIDTRGRHDELSLELAVSADVIFLPTSFSMDDVLPTLMVVESLRDAGVPASRFAIIFCRTGSSRKQEQYARSILLMNQISVLRAVLPQKDGFVSLSAIGRTGREAPQSHLRSIALTVDQEIVAFIDSATQEKTVTAVNGAP